MKSSLIILLVIVCTTLANSIHSQEYRVFSKDNGIIEQFTTDITQDSSGNVWFTGLEGINKWDGSSWKSFPLIFDKEWNNNGVIGRSLANGINGEMWLYSQQILNDNNPPIKIANNEIIYYPPFYLRGAGFDKSGNLLFYGSEKSGKKSSLVKVVGNEYKVIFQNLDETHWFTNFYIDSRSNIWIQLKDAFLVKYPDDKGVIYSKPDGLVIPTSSNLYIHPLKFTEDKNNNIWVGSKEGLFRFSDDKWTAITKKDGLISTKILGLGFDSKGNLWIYTPKGISRLSANENTWTNYLSGNKTIVGDGPDFYAMYHIKNHGQTMFYVSPKNVSTEQIFSFLMEDKSGNMWAVSNNAIFEFTGEKWIKYTEKDSLFSEHISSLTMDSTGNVWVGHYKGGVSRYDGKSWTNYKLGEHYYTTNAGNSGPGLLTALAMNLAEGGKWELFPGYIFADKNNSIWYICDGGGVFKYEDNQWSLIHRPPFNTKYDFYIDRKGNIWINNQTINKPHPGDGLMKYDIHTKKFTNLLKLLKGNLSNFFEEKDGNVWFTTDTQLFFFPAESK